MKTSLTWLLMTSAIISRAAFVGDTCRIPFPSLCLSFLSFYVFASQEWGQRETQTRRQKAISTVSVNSGDAKWLNFRKIYSICELIEVRFFFLILLTRSTFEKTTKVIKC